MESSCNGHISEMRSRVLTVAVPALLAAALLATTIKYYGQVWGL